MSTVSCRMCLFEFYCIYTALAGYCRQVDIEPGQPDPVVHFSDFSFALTKAVLYRQTLYILDQIRYTGDDHFQFVILEFGRK